jgi:LPS sulfotransferase NodH
MHRIRRSFSIAFGLRTGSNALCELLTRNGAGRPTELFQYPYKDNWFFQPYRSLPEPDAIAQVIDQATVNGVFGSKMTHDHRARFEEAIAPTGARTVGEFLPHHKWIWMRRRDRVLQAISLLRAESENVWTLTSPPETPAADAEYDFCSILANYMLQDVGDLAWEAYWAAHGISPLVLFYEDAFADLERTLGTLVDYLDLHDVVIKPYALDLDLRMQRNARSLALKERFLDDLAAIGTTASEDSGPERKRWQDFFRNRRWRDAARDAG